MIKIEIPVTAIESHRQKYSNTITQILSSLSDEDNFLRAERCVKSKGHISKSLGATYFRFLYEFHRKNDILISCPDKLLELLTIEEDIVRRLWRGARPEKINRLLQKIFNYCAFCNNSGISLHQFAINRESSQQEPSDWGAFKFLQSLGIFVCPYCNADTIFATTVVKKNQNVNIRSALDHFFPQSRYPFLGLSLFNLVPACSRCNSNIKGARDASWAELINPYQESFHEAMYFFCELNSAEAAWGKPENIKLKVSARDDSAISEKGKRTADFFSLEKIYNTIFLHEASRVVQKKYIFQNSAYRDFIRDLVSGISCADMDELIWGCSMLDKNINKFRLSKLTIDLVSDGYIDDFFYRSDGD